MAARKKGKAQGPAPREHDFDPAGVLSCGRSGRVLRALPTEVVGSAGWILLFTVQGEARFGPPEEPAAIRNGDLSLFEPGFFREAEVAARDGWEFFWAGFIPRVGWHMHVSRWPRPARGLRQVHIGDAAEARQIRGTFLRCILDARRQNPFTHLLTLNAIGEAILRATAHHSRTFGPSVLSERVRRVLEHIQLHFPESLSVASLAQVANLSPSRFAHRFKEEMGGSVKDYLLRFRLSRAARFLEVARHEVKRVSSLVGFGTPSFFTRQFRRAFSMTPSEYRARMTAAKG